jgi:short-subunit dehydrogenase
MSTFNDKYGSWALIAGAAEGLGEAFSKELAAKKMNLVMIDNQGEKMKTLAGRLEKEFLIQTICLTIDLAQKDASQQIMTSIDKLDCRLLIYVAAFSRVKPFLSVTDDELDHFIEINCRTQIKLVHSFAATLKTKNGGGILLLSSLAGLIGMQMVATYAATKAFTWNLAEALHYELKPFGIDVMACISGAASTPTYLATKPKYGLLKPKVHAPQEVAKAALSKLGKRTLFIPGSSNRLNYFFLTRILPRNWASSIANRTMGKMYADKFGN